MKRNLFNAAIMGVVQSPEFLHAGKQTLYRATLVVQVRPYTAITGDSRVIPTPILADPIIIGVWRGRFYQGGVWDLIEDVPQ